jgi:hypothetical protein
MSREEKVCSLKAVSVFHLAYILSVFLIMIFLLNVLISIYICLVFAFLCLWWSYSEH